MRQLGGKREFFGGCSGCLTLGVGKTDAIEAVKVGNSQGECRDSLNTYDIDSYKNEGTKSENFAYGFRGGSWNPHLY